MDALRQSSLYYLVALIVSVVGSQFFLYTSYGEPFVAGQSTSIVFAFAMIPLVFVLWLMAPFHGLRITRLRAVLILLAGLWLMSVIRTILDNGSLNYTFLITPVLLLAIFIKPPSQRDAARLALITALLLIATMILAQVMDALDVRPFREFIPMRWFPELSGGFRWEGVFGDPNNAGFMAAFLFVYGLSINSRWKWLLVIIGIIVLIHSESRSAILAAVIGALTLLFLQPKARLAIRSKWIFRIALITAALLMVAAVIALDPSLNGRISIWSAIFDLWQTNYLFGIGSPGFENAANSGAIPWGNSDGHSILFDTLVRIGILPFLIVTFLIILSIQMSWDCRKFDAGQSFAILITFLSGALTYTVVGWAYFGVQILPWLISLLLANGTLTETTGKLKRV
jgi:hypothetical protein